MRIRKTPAPTSAFVKSTRWAPQSSRKRGVEIACPEVQVAHTGNEGSLQAGESIGVTPV